MLLGSRVSLGPVVPADFPSMFCWANDAAAARLNLGYRPVDFLTHQQWCESFGKDPTKVNFAIRKVGDTAIIGMIEIMNISAVHRTAEIGIRIGEEANRGCGYGREALSLTLEFCWRHLNLNRAQLIVLSHNERALRAYRSVGFVQEGLLHQAVFVDGEWANLVVMASLRPAQIPPNASATTPLVTVADAPAVAVA